MACYGVFTVFWSLGVIVSWPFGRPHNIPTPPTYQICNLVQVYCTLWWPHFWVYHSLLRIMHIPVCCINCTWRTQNKLQKDKAKIHPGKGHWQYFIPKSTNYRFYFLVENCKFEDINNGDLESTISSWLMDRHCWQNRKGQLLLLMWLFQEHHC